MEEQEPHFVDDDQGQTGTQEVDGRDAHIVDGLADLGLEEDAKVHHEDDFEGEDMDADEAVVLDAHEEERDLLVEGEGLDEEGGDLVEEGGARSQKREVGPVDGAVPADGEDDEVVLDGIGGEGGEGEDAPAGGILHLLDEGHHIAHHDGTERDEAEVDVGGRLEDFEDDEHELSVGAVGALDGPEVVHLLASEVLLQPDRICDFSEVVVP